MEIILQRYIKGSNMEFVSEQNASVNVDIQKVATSRNVSDVRYSNRYEN